MVDGPGVCEWVVRVGPHDIDHGTGGVAVVDGLALVVRTAIGKPAQDASVGLQVSPVTVTDRLVAVHTLLAIAHGFPERQQDPMVGRAKAAIQSPEFWEARASLAFGSPLHGDMGPDATALSVQRYRAAIAICCGGDGFPPPTPAG